MNIIPFAIVAFIGAGSLYGESPRRGEGGPPPVGGADRGRNFKGFFENADSNGDGVVSPDEFSALERISKLPVETQREIFKRFDKNGDGLIQASEMRPPQRPEGGGRPFPKLHELDADKDGKVSFAEFEEGPFADRIPKERLREFFGRLDRNSDGSLSAADMPKDNRPYQDRPREGRQEQHDPSRMIEMLDKNDDEALSFEEFRQAPWLKEKGEDEQEDLFEKLDKNGDLSIELSELPVGGPKRPEGREGEGNQVPRGAKRPDGSGPDGGKGPRGPGGPSGNR
jgi:Ca2+-binding EF-hand superfamily protein